MPEFLSLSASIDTMSLNLKPAYEVKDTTAGEVAVFRGTDVEIHDFIDWVVRKRRTAGEFIELHPGLTRQHIRDYLLASLPDRFLTYGEKREWAPNHEPTL